MSKLKKIASVGLALTTVVWLSGATMIIPKAQAQSATELLQAQITALLAQITLLQSQLAALGGGTPATACTFTRDLTMGSKGDDVKCLQQYLNGAGYKVADTGAGSPGSETTYLGSLTKAALAKWQAANSVTPSVGYFGPKSRAKYTELAGVPGKPQCNDAIDNDGDGKIDYPTDPGCDSATDGNETDGVVGTGLALSLAYDNPAAMTVPKGASSIPFLKFNVAGSGTLDNLTFKRVGIGATGDFESSGINLYDGTTRLTSGKSINSTTHEVTFNNLALAISGTKTLTLVANTTSSATAGNVDAFDLTGAGGTPTPTGFPLTGKSMTIGGATVGTVSVDDGSAPSNPNIGATGALLLTLQVTAGSAEDIEIQRIAMSEGGTVQNEYLTNFKMKYGDQVVATADKVGAKDLVTFTFTTPFKIEKGQQKNFDISADISGASRSSDTIILYVDNAADIVAKGLLYGYTVSPTIASIDTTGESDTLTLQGANITMNFKGPVTGDIALRGTDVKVFEFDFASKNNI
ncbi:MAG TPA: peptidoglycan-binding domain-containing protein, partial [Candidatus Paceibacterota bacterium]